MARIHPEVTPIAQQPAFPIQEHRPPADIERGDNPAIARFRRHPHLGRLRRDSTAVKVGRLALEVECDPPRLGGTTDQRPNPRVIRRRGQTNLVGHAQTNSGKVGQCRKGSILILPSIMPRARHKAR